MLIMSGRIEKSKSRKTQNRLDLAVAIESSGRTSEMPCTRCFRQNMACKMDERSSRCAECVRAGRSCDGNFVASSLSRLLAQQRKLEAEEEDAEEAFFLLQTQLSTAANRLARLRRMKKVLKEKSSEAFRRGMQELDEEDGVASSVPNPENFIVGDLRSLGVPDVPDWSSYGLGEEFSGLGPLVTSDSSNKPPEPQGAVRNAS